MRNAMAGLVALALGVVTVEARADDGRWVMAEDGTWTQTEEAPSGDAAPPAAAAPAVGASSPPQHAHGVGTWSAPGEDEERADDDPPMRSGWGFAGGVVLTSVGGSLLVGAALASLPIGYEGNGGGDPGAGVATVAVLGAAATAGGIGLILWGRAPASGRSAAVTVGLGDVRVGGSF